MFHYIQHDIYTYLSSWSQEGSQKMVFLAVSLRSTWYLYLCCHPDRRKDLKRCWCLDVSLRSTWHLYLCCHPDRRKDLNIGFMLFRCFTTFNMTDKVQNNLTCYPDVLKDLKRCCCLAVSGVATFVQIWHEYLKNLLRSWQLSYPV